MQLELHRVDYLLVGLTKSHCLKVLPIEDVKTQQKVAVTDQDGVLHFFSIKKENVQIHFKTLPGPTISSLQLAGAIGTPTDKIFLAQGNEIRGFNKKGKLFLVFNTNLTENITSMYILGSDLFVCGNHVYNHYRDCKDIGSYLCGDRIVDVVALYPDKESNRITTILACEGRMLRVLEHSRVIHSIETESSPSILHIYKSIPSNKIIYGTINGQIGVLQIGRVKISHKNLLPEGEPYSAISCIDSYDLVGDGTPNIIVGRLDGIVEVFNVNLQESEEEIIKIFHFACNESVTGVQGGQVGCPGYDEILVSTYTGRVFGLTKQLTEKHAGDSVVQGYTFSQETRSKILKLSTDIEELEQRLLKEREKYQISTQVISDGLSALPLLSVKDSMYLRTEDSTYILSLEVQTSIDNVLLQSDVPLELLDVEKNSAIISYSNINKNDGNCILATYRCQVNTNRLEIKLRTREGESGTLQVYITPNIQPKCCQLKQYIIRPLSLHMRIYKDNSERSYNILTLKGNFSIAEMHTWISKCLPDVPDKTPVEDEAVLIFKLTFIDTILQCTYKRGEAEFKSDNIATVSIIKDFISMEATKRKIKLTITYALNEDSIKNTLILINPILEAQIKLFKQISVLNSLQELDIYDEETIKKLSRSYQDLIKNEKSLREQYNLRPGLEQLRDFITDIYVNRCKFMGLNMKSKLTDLSNCLNNYNFEDLLQFFQPPNEEIICQYLK